MKKNISYRDKLLELAEIYKISDIKNYNRNKKYLTTAQIEHILKKNKVPIPSERNKSILEIHTKKIIKPIHSAGNKFSGFFNNVGKNINKSYNLFFKNIFNFLIIFKNWYYNLFLAIGRITIKILNSFYDGNIDIKKTNQFVSSLAVAFLAVGVSISLFTVFKNIDSQTQIISKAIEKPLIKKDQKIIKKEDKKEDKKVAKLKPEKEDKKVAKLKPKKEDKKVAKLKPEKEDKNIAKEFVLPNLNLKTETVLNLFKDVQYDLEQVRYEKKVKPIYFTQFPKDLDEISSIELKKETFIKIVLPLVVAENQKILDDRIMLKKIISKKMTSDKEKLWLRQKLKEYKVKKGNFDELTKRMDIIPISIALSQAAKESGWGTSRFALEGNAIFGQWTWSGTGIAPLERTKEQNHKILRFPILRASVKAYKNNLNTHKSYKEFREKRSKLRSRKTKIQGLKLIHTLDNYAETGVEYTRILEKIIEQNSLLDFENVKLTNTVEKRELDL